MLTQIAVGTLVGAYAGYKVGKKSYEMKLKKHYKEEYKTMILGDAQRLVKKMSK